MTPEQRQEEISKAYLHAVAAACGYAVAGWSQDHGGIDATIGAAVSVGGGHLSRPKVDVQLKASTQSRVVQEERIAWRLGIAHYDSLRAPAHTPHLLVVLMLPDDVDQAVQHTVEQLIVRRCAYWALMTGMPAAPAGTRSRTVHVPMSQVFSPDTLRAIMGRVSNGASP